MMNGMRSGPRVAALVGPYLSGKTTLLEALLLAAGNLHRKGSVHDGSTAGDGSPEARARHMSVEMNLASGDYLGERWTFIDCPGSVELQADTLRALQVADVAIVVCEPSADKAGMLAPLFRMLDEMSMPHMVYINKMDQLAGSDVRVRDVLAALQGVSERPLVLREVPIRDNGSITGHVDLVSERAYHWRPGQTSDLVPMPATVKEREQDARQQLLEALADFDDQLLEQLLEDVTPERDDVYRHLAQTLAEDLIVPVFLGSADRDHGVRRLLKALRHEVPTAEHTAARLEIAARTDGPLIEVFKTQYAAHAGKLSLARIWSGAVQDGMTLAGERVGGVYAFGPGGLVKKTTADAGEVVALARLDKPRAGDLLTEKEMTGRAPFWPAAPEPVYALTVEAEQKTDEVKLTAALAKLAEEDASLSFRHDTGIGELVLSGQGPVHLQIALDRLRSRFNLPVRSRAPGVPYRETIRRGSAQHARFKRQTGGHGQFADVHLEVRPLARGEGFRFEDKVVGGVIPRTYIPAVEDGAREAMARGPLGFPVVDIAVALTNGQYHSVDSSELAFKTAGRMAVQEALTKGEPVLLEPILQVTFVTPTDYTSRVQRLISGRRGQILGFDSRTDWPGWDEVKALIPQADMGDLVIELRSLTLGLGGYSASFSHLAELVGKQADRVVESRAAAAAA